MTRRRPAGAIAAAAALALALAGCADDPDPGTSPTAVASPVATDAAPDPTPTPTPTEEPTGPGPTIEPSPSPSPTATSTPVAVTEENALAAAADRRAAREGCGGPDDTTTDGFHEVVAEVDEGLLTLVLCFLGAYQGNGELLLFTQDGLQAVPVEQWVNGEVLETNEVTGFVGAAANDEVVNDVKYRGLGDCGLFQRWRWTGEGLELLEAREQQCEDGGDYVPPEQWPLVHGG